MIAAFQMRAESFDTAHDLRLENRTRVKDGLKKIKKRHPDGEQGKKRDKLRKSIVLQEVHRIAAKETRAGRLETKHKPHLGDLLVILKAYIGDKIKDPFKIMAAVSLLFSLRPEKKDCHEQKGADGQLGNCTHFDDKTNSCKRNNPFRAPCFDNERHALWQMTKRAEEQSPSTLQHRLSLPENQV